MLPLFASLLIGNVSSITDGDTLKVRDIEGETKTVRLACIDSPERRQRGGLESTLSLHKLLPPGQMVEVEIKGRDRYGRTIGLVRVDEKSVNLQLVESGSALVYWQHFSPCLGSGYDFYAAQEKARVNALGFWGLPLELQIPPWVWRKK